MDATRSRPWLAPNVWAYATEVDEPKLMQAVGAEARSRSASRRSMRRSPVVLSLSGKAQPATQVPLLAPCRAGEARALPHSRDGRGHEAFTETTRWPPLHPHIVDAKIPILSALDNHFSGAMNSSNGLLTAGADCRVVFLSGLFHTIRFRSSSSASL